MTKRRDRRAALKFLKRAMKRYGRPRSIVTDRLRSYRSAMKVIGNAADQECGRWLNNRAENSHQPFRRRERAMAKLRGMKTLQKFAAAHASIHNHFNNDRHLNAQSSVAKYMVKRRGPPGQGWRMFLRNHAPDIAAMNLFIVPTISFGLLYALVIVRLDRRELVWINVTANPTAEWIARQITEAFPWEDAPQYLIRDRDRIYGTVFTRRLRAMGIRDKPTTPASPWQNGFAERLIGSIPRECVDYFVVLGEAHLRRILRAYARYYNDIRTHWSLDKIHRSLAPFSGPEAFCHTRVLADFITTTFGFRFSVQTPSTGARAVGEDHAREQRTDGPRSAPGAFAGHHANL